MSPILFHLDWEFLWVSSTYPWCSLKVLATLVSQLTKNPTNKHQCFFFLENLFSKWPKKVVFSKFFSHQIPNIFDISKSLDFVLSSNR
jgi:hypothetical protein